MTPTQEFLLNNLPGTIIVLTRKAALLGISKRSLFRAARELGVTRSVSGYSVKKSASWTIDPAKKAALLKNAQREERACHAILQDIIELKADARTDLEHDIYKHMERTTRTYIQRRLNKRRRKR